MENALKIRRMPIELFVAELRAAKERHDGYIMGARGQDPRTGHLDLQSTEKPKSSWGVNGYYYKQYSGKQRTQALEWRKNSVRVWDCNGLAEGIYELWCGENINTRARYNYAGWCGIKGKGMIPAARRVPGAAVFWGESAGSIHHVAYLQEPVNAAHPEGDWILTEARGVMHGVVGSTLYDRDPDYWGWMTNRFDYSIYGEGYEPEIPQLGDRLLKHGSEGEDVKQLQSALIRLGYDCGKWGADGDFGDATEMAVEEFQRACGLTVDGQYGPKSHAAMEFALSVLEQPVEDPEIVRIEGGNCWVRTAPNTGGQRLGVAYRGDALPFGGEISENGWLLVEYKGQNGWVSGKYGRLEG